MVMFLTVENLEIQKEFPAKITQFTQGINVLDPPACFRIRETGLLPFTGMDIFCRKLIFLTLENAQK
jgi:hypothetical protein